MSKRSSSDMVFELMYCAFIDIRENALKTEDKIAYHLSDLFHNIPDMLKRVEKGEIEYSDVLDAVTKKAEERGISSWIQNNLDQIE